jgi:cell division protein FtsQ
MSIKSNIRKILMLALWIVPATGILILLVAAISKKNHKICKGVEITIKGADKYYFLDKQDIMKIIVPDKTNPPAGKPLSSFDLHKLEGTLKRNAWVKNAELFFDNNGIFRVNIEEREPVARLFTVSGNSFYIDSGGVHLPLNDGAAVKLPVYTNFPTDKTVLKGTDSALMQQLKQINRYLCKDPFWMAQVAQVDITAAGTFEMIPVIGNHVIVFGDGNDCEAKFHRLWLFYRQIAATVGFDKYSIVNVQYNKQVVATRKGTVSKSDSLQTLKNVRQLIEASHKLPVDTVSTAVDNNIAVSQQPDTTLTVLTTQGQNAAKTPADIKKNIKGIPTTTYPSSVKSRVPFPAVKPKAIMKRASG